jgi:dsRNA-specific ribonuclease
MEAVLTISFHHLKIREFVKDVQDELSKPGFNSFGLGDCKAPKVLGDIVESIAGAMFLDSGYGTSVVWKVIFLNLPKKNSAHPHLFFNY